MKISNSLATTSTTSSSCMLVTPLHKQGRSKLKKIARYLLRIRQQSAFVVVVSNTLLLPLIVRPTSLSVDTAIKWDIKRKVCKSFQFSESTDKVQISSATFSAASVSRPTVPILLDNTYSVNVIVDTGAQVSFLNGIQLQSVNKTFHNFDGSRILVHGCISKVDTTFNNKVASCAFYIVDVPYSIIGVDIISALKLSISCNGDSRLAATMVDSNPRTVSEVREETAMSIKLKDDSPSMLITLVRWLPFALEALV